MSRIETAEGLLGTPEEESVRALANGERILGPNDLTVRTVIDVGCAVGEWTNQYVGDAEKYPDLGEKEKKDA